MEGPLHGIRVLEVANFLAVPSAGALMAGPAWGGRDADAIYVASMGVTSTTDTASFTTKLTAPAGSFQETKKYFVYVTCAFADDLTTSRIDYEIRYGSAVKYTGVIEPAGSANDSFPITWIDVYDQHATPEANNNTIN